MLTAIYLYGFLNQSLGLILGIFFFNKDGMCAFKVDNFAGGLSTAQLLARR
jgi:hypothetical protein